MKFPGKAPHFRSLKFAPFAVLFCFIFTNVTGFMFSHVLAPVAAASPATARVYMPRGTFTTVIDVKTNAVSQLASGESNHIALPIPGTNLLVLTQGGKGVMRIADKRPAKSLAVF